MVVLPAPFGSEQPEDLATVHGEAHTVDRDDLVVTLDKLPRLDHRLESAGGGGSGHRRHGFDGRQRVRDG